MILCTNEDDIQKIKIQIKKGLIFKSMQFERALTHPPYLKSAYSQAFAVMKKIYTTVDRCDRLINNCIPSFDIAMGQTSFELDLENKYNTVSPNLLLTNNDIRIWACL